VVETHQHAAKILKPCVYPLDFPALAVATDRSANAKSSLDADFSAE
jgi:hypothetical protein